MLFQHTLKTSLAGADRDESASNKSWPSFSLPHRDWLGVGSHQLKHPPKSLTTLTSWILSGAENGRGRRGGGGGGGGNDCYSCGESEAELSCCRSTVLQGTRKHIPELAPLN